MRNYEVTFIVDPVLSSDEIKATAQAYVEHLKSEGATIVHFGDMGLRTLAYPINKRNSGVYFCIELEAADGAFMDKFELTLRRDERILRFLTVHLDKFGVKYNDDKRKGLIGKKRASKAEVAEQKKEQDDQRREDSARRHEVKAAAAAAAAEKAETAEVPAAENAGEA